MEYKKERTVLTETENLNVKKKKKEVSQLVIEANTIYEIDLDCQNRKDCSCKSYKSDSNKKGV